jgi:photosystem II stability/assembly factor-like uncharacterized protein
MPGIVKLFILSIALSIAAAVSGYAATNTWTALAPFGGSVTTLAVDSRNPGTVYAATAVTAGDVRGRLFKTTDGGAHWALLNSALGAASIAIDPQDSNTIYIGLRGRFPGAWVFKSTDGGANFSPASTGLEDVQFYGGLVVDPVNSSTVYALTIAYLMDPCRLNTACVVTQVFKSTDGGVSWSPYSSGLPPTNSLISALAIDPQDSNILYAGLYGVSGGTSGVFKSANGGASWSPINSSVTVCCTYFGQGLVVDRLDHDIIYAASFGSVVKLSSRGAVRSTAYLGYGNIFSLGEDAQNPGTLYAGIYNEVFKSSDGGVNWTATAFPSVGFETPYTLAADPLNSGTVYVGSLSGYGVVKTTDGGASWKSFGVGAVNVTSVTVAHNSGTLYALLSDFPGRVFKTMDGGMNWSAVWGLQAGASLVVDPRDSNTLYAVRNVYEQNLQKSIEKSIDGGATWDQVGQASFAKAAADLGLQRNYGFPGPLLVDPRNPDTLYVAAVPPDCCRTDIFQSTDGGINWSITAMLAGNLAELLVMDPQNSATLYASGAYRTTVSKSTDGGVTWTDSALPPEASAPYEDDYWTMVRVLAVDPQDSNVVYVTGSGGIFKSTDGGTTWVTMNSGLAPYICKGSDACVGEPYLVGSLVIDPRTGALYAASTAGVLRSTDGASNWSPVTGGLPAAPGANSLALDPSDPSRLYMAGAGVSTITLVP